MVIQRHLYLNIYERAGEFTISHYHETRAEADEAAGKRDDRVSCLRIEFIEGQHDPDEGFFLNINEYSDTFTLSQTLYGARKEADDAHTKSSKRVACVRVPLQRGRYLDS